jgi:hypothetical protein
MYTAARLAVKIAMMLQDEKRKRSSAATTLAYSA